MKKRLGIVVLLVLGGAALWWLTRPTAKVAEAPAALKSLASTPMPKPAQVEAPKSAPSTAAATATTNADSDTVQVRLSQATLQHLRFNSFQGFELTDEAQQLLGVTPEESARLQAVLDELQQRVQAHDAANTHEISFTDLNDPKYATLTAMVSNGGKNTGQLTAYRISPDTEAEQAAAKEWLNQNVGNILGPERSAVFLGHAQDALGMVLGGTDDRIVVFRDEGAFTNWYMYYGNGGISGNSGKDTVPKELQYLFAPKDNAAVN
jgi:hypothetical protein